MLRNLDNCSVAQLGYFELALTRASPEQIHSAIIFKDRDDATWLFHLGWNHLLCSENLREDYQWISPDLSVSEKKFFAVLAGKIRKGDPVIDYGFDPKGFAFDPETGEMTSGALGKGLTCATFIKLILEAFGTRLLDEETWPKNANIDWQRRIVSLMTHPSSKATPEQISALTKDVGNRRFAPAEVVGVATLHDRPVPFEQAQRIASHLESELKPVAQS